MAYKLTKNSLQKDQISKNLPQLKKYSSEGTNFYTVNVKTNSNLMVLNDSFQLPYETNNFYDKIKQNENKIIKFKTCQYCNSKNSQESFYCFYCGNKLIG